MMLDMGRQEACAMADLVALRSVITPLVMIKSTKKLLESCLNVVKKCWSCLNPHIMKDQLTRIVLLDFFCFFFPLIRDNAVPGCI